MKSFHDLGLSANLISNATQAGYKSPFPIQEQAIPVILSGKDVMGIARTGSGKTASFALPILEKLQKTNTVRNRNIAVLLLVPTRELAIQIQDVFSDLNKNLDRKIKTMAVYGGISINPQMKDMIGVEVLIATPGRLLDLLDHNALSLSEVAIFGVDEADKMFQMGFDEEMNRIIEKLPKKRQNLLFSATLNDKVSEMKTRLVIDPEVIEIEASETELGEAQIEQSAYAVSPEIKGPFLRYLIKSKNYTQVLVFVSASRTADNLVEKLNKNGIKAAAIHGKKSQGGRNNALLDFKDGLVDVLVATDLIARGIDIEDLPVVINYELPRSPLDYVHRIGRTGRAGKLGTAISLITPEDEHHFKIIQKKAKIRIALQPTDPIDLKGY
ncbi:DEAD/DEAH box helicase [Flavobacterium agricola]|uniref:DEAD/DEAH box helicase n=1 Tax=Flavobacterium agricola TaxID=2870839 RepID=A0ABY6LZN1_9FLAO|nr:DEAD/DEAH box helicase [Flavobacterium agricola]UYW01694.1 DEAD/DEAH box helicase [Flavobacterium agricola]